MIGYEANNEHQLGTATWITGNILSLYAKKGSEVRLRHLFYKMHSARTKLCRPLQCQDCKGGLNHLTTNNYRALTIFKVQCKAENIKTLFHLQMDCAMEVSQYSRCL